MYRKAKICRIILFYLLLVGLFSGYVPEVNAATMSRKNSEITVTIINPNDSELSNNTKSLPQTGNDSDNRYFLGIGILLFIGLYLMVKRGEEQKR